MNYHRVIVLTAVLMIGIHLPGYAVHKQDACWMLSDDTGNVLVGRFLKDSEDQARNQDFKRAAESLKQVINLAATNDVVRTELDREIAGGSLLLHIIAARADYLNDASRHTDYTVVEECRQTLSNYAERAAGKRWDAYKRLYIAESFCFAPENPHNNRVNNLKDLFLYDPLDPDQCFTGLHYNGWPTNELRWVLDTYYAHGGPRDEKALFYEMKYAARCGGDALKYAADYIERADPGIGRLQELFCEVGQVITNQSLESLLRYRDALTNSALRKSPEKEHIQAIGFIIDERNNVDRLVSIQRSSQ